MKYIRVKFWSSFLESKIFKCIFESTIASFREKLSGIFLMNLCYQSRSGTLFRGIWASKAEYKIFEVIII